MFIKGRQTLEGDWVALIDVEEGALLSMDLKTPQSCSLPSLNANSALVLIKVLAAPEAPMLM